MNRPCPPMQDRIADYVLGILGPRESEILREHLAGCDACRQYVQSLKGQARSLVALGGQIDEGMEARQDRVIAALQNVAPAEARPSRVLPFAGRFLKTAVAAALILGAGVTIGRWTAPRPADVQQLRNDLEASLVASLQPALQKNVLAEVDRRLETGLLTREASLRNELADQLRGDLQLFAAQFTAGSERQMEKRFVELVQLIEEARLKDRQHVARALDRIEQNWARDKTQIGLGFQSLVALATNATPAVQHQ